MLRSLITKCRPRLAALAAGAAAATASSLAIHAQCRSVTLDDTTAASLSASLSTALGADMAVNLSDVSTDAIIEELKARLFPAPKNVAFVFAKPHANTPEVLKVIEAKFAEKGITVLKEGVVTGEEIDQKGYIDQHYYAIAEKSTLTSGGKLPVNPDKFKATFGEEWTTVVAEGRAFNALEFKNKFAAFSKPGALDKAWDETNVGKKTRVKLGGGFYCGQITVDGVKYYTFNAFFMTMRGKFTGADAKIHYYVVEFDSDTLKWADFRGKVLGPTNPAEAPADSLRGMVNATWQELGLTSAPDTGDNAVHASASPFEGLAERTNWLGGDYTITGDKADEFAKAMTAEGIDADTIKAWSVDPQVVLKKGEDKKGSLFDQVEDMDFGDCLAKLKELYAAKP